MRDEDTNTHAREGGIEAKTIATNSGNLLGKFAVLPHELILGILSWLSDEDKASSRQVNSWFSQVLIELMLENYDLRSKFISNMERKLRVRLNVFDENPLAIFKADGYINAAGESEVIDPRKLLLDKGCDKKLAAQVFRNLAINLNIVDNGCQSAVSDWQSHNMSLYKLGQKVHLQFSVNGNPTLDTYNFKNAGFFNKKNLQTLIPGAACFCLILCSFVPIILLEYQHGATESVLIALASTFFSIGMLGVLCTAGMYMRAQSRDTLTRDVEAQSLLNGVDCSDYSAITERVGEEIESRHSASAEGGGLSEDEEPVSHTFVPSSAV